MNLTAEVEEQLKLKVLVHLEKGRPGWDVPHTLACVHWMKKLLEHESGDPAILIPAIYLHDIAYAKFSNENIRQRVMELKELHMQEGARITRELLPKLGFDIKAVEEIAFLIETHDKLDEIKTPNQQLVFEADSLGQIDRERVEPTFSREDAIISLERFKANRAPRFKTKTGKKFLKLLLKQAELYMEKL